MKKRLLRSKTITQSRRLPDKLNSASRYFRTANVTVYWRTRIRKLAKAAIQQALPDRRFPLSQMNDQQREYLYDAIFECENELESRAGGQSDHPQVIAMCRVRHRVAVDLRWDDP